MFRVLHFYGLLGILPLCELFIWGGHYGFLLWLNASVLGICFKVRKSLRLVTPIFFSLKKIASDLEAVSLWVGSCITQVESSFVTENGAGPILSPLIPLLSLSTYSNKHQEIKKYTYKREIKKREEKQVQKKREMSR